MADQAQQSKVFIVPFWLFTYLGIFFGDQTAQIHIPPNQDIGDSSPEISERISPGYDNGRKSQTTFLVFKKGVR